MCELLFKHVGDFRKHTEEYVRALVDRMHDPKENLRQLAPDKVSEIHKVFLDEEDQSLYHTSPPFQGSMERNP